MQQLAALRCVYQGVAGTGLHGAGASVLRAGGESESQCRCRPRQALVHKCAPFEHVTTHAVNCNFFNIAVSS